MEQYRPRSQLGTRRRDANVGDENGLDPLPKHDGHKVKIYDRPSNASRLTPNVAKILLAVIVLILLLVLLRFAFR